MLVTTGKGFFRIRTTVFRILNTQRKFYVAIFEDAIRQAGGYILETNHSIFYESVCRVVTT